MTIDYETPKRAFLQYVLYVCFKRKWLIAWGFLLVFASVYLATKISYPVYHAIAKVWVHRAPSQQVSFVPEMQIPSMAVGIFSPAFNWVEAMTGQFISMEVAKDFRLDEYFRKRYQEPEGFREQFWYYFKKTLVSPVRAAIWVCVKVGLMDQPEFGQKDFLVVASNKVFEEMISLGVSNQFSDIMSIAVYGPTREYAQDIANYLADRLIRKVVEGEQGVARFAVDFAEQQLEDITAKLETSEDTLKQYQKQFGVVDISQQKNLQASRTDGLETKLDSLARERQEIESKVRTLDREIENQKRAFVSSIILQKNFSDKQEAEVDLATADKTLSTVQQQLQETNQRAQELIEADYVSSKLKREVGIYSTIWQQFQDKLAKLKIETVSRLKASAMEVVDPAFLPVDADPVWPKDTLNYIIGALCGLALGLAMAFILEFFNDSLRTEIEVEKELHLPVLGTLPEFELTRLP
jgi:capsular polysaccharide biosynthesis protein